MSTKQKKQTSFNRTASLHEDYWCQSIFFKPCISVNLSQKVFTDFRLPYLCNWFCSQSLVFKLCMTIKLYQNFFIKFSLPYLYVNSELKNWLPLIALQLCTIIFVANALSFNYVWALNSPRFLSILDFQNCIYVYTEQKQQTSYDCTTTLPNDFWSQSNVLKPCMSVKLDQKFCIHFRLPYLYMSFLNTKTDFLQSYCNFPQLFL